MQETTVHDLIQQVAHIGNMKLFGGKLSNLKVKGIANNVNINKNYQYFSLSDGVQAIGVKCPVSFGATEGECVIVEGTPSLFPTKDRGGMVLQFRINGKVTGNWKPRINEKLFIDLENRPRNKLATFLRRNSVDNLLLLGSQIGINDVLSHAGEFASRIAYELIPVSDKQDAINAITQASKKEASAYAFARGGDDSGLLLWEDPEFVHFLTKLETPFYTALGHAHRHTLSDRTADESFHSPTGLGEAIAAALELKQELLISQHQIEALKDEKVYLEHAVNESTQASQRLQSSHTSNVEQLNTRHREKIKQRTKLAFISGFSLPVVVSLIAYYVYVRYY